MFAWFVSLRSNYLRRKLSRWLALFLIALFGAIALSMPYRSVAQTSLTELRGVWLTANDSQITRDRNRLSTAVSELQQLNFNTLYPVVWNSGYALYPSATAQQAGIQPFVYRGFEGQDVLADTINQAHQRGLLAIPWFEFGFMAPPSSELALRHPAWLTQKRDGSKTWVGAAGEVVWLNPFHPEVQQFITNLVLEVTSNYDADGVQFDDHTSLPNEFGYDPYTLALYKKETKKDAPANPQDPDWVKWRADKITAFMTQLKQQVRARKPDAIFSIAPNPYVVAYRSYLQDWLTWVRRGVADELIVQVYRPDLQSFVQEASRPELQEARQKIPTAVGILTGLRNRPVSIDMVQAKVQQARARGLGFTFFFYESLWNIAAPEPSHFRLARFQWLLARPAPRAIARSPITPVPSIADRSVGGIGGGMGGDIEERTPARDSQWLLPP
ncbi:MAG TPA: glycoside hydrolase family 10 protein [Stenomitos sp.]